MANVHTLSSVASTAHAARSRIKQDVRRMIRESSELKTLVGELARATIGLCEVYEVCFYFIIFNRVYKNLI